MKEQALGDTFWQWLARKWCQFWGEVQNEEFHAAQLDELKELKKSGRGN